MAGFSVLRGAPPPPAAPAREAAAAPPDPLSEGPNLGSFVKSLVTGGFEPEIERLRSEARDVRTPEQQVVVVHKVVALLRKLMALRHNPTAVQRFVHYSADWFSRHVEGNKGAKELSLRVGEGIADLSRIRDQLLSKQWPGGPEAVSRRQGSTPERAEAAARLRAEVNRALSDIPALKDSDF